MALILEVRRETLEGWSAARGEPTWLTQLRVDALAKAAELPLPHREKTRVEDYALATVVLQESQSQAAVTQGQGMGSMNGTTVSSLPAAVEARGVIACDIMEAIRRYPERVRPLLEARPVRDKLEALAVALMDGGAYLYVPPNVQMEEPLALSLHFAASAYPFTAVEMGRLAEMTLVQEFASGDGEIVLNGSVSLQAAEGATLRYACLQTLGAATRMYLPRTAEVGRDARIDWIVAEIGAAVSIVSQDTHLTGEGASSDSVQIFVGSDEQVMDIVAAMHHEMSQTSSTIVSHGVLKDSCHCGYVALTDIRKGAHGTSGWQRENTLMLSQTARADLIPWLEIEDADVSAGHAATAGQINQEHLFYLMSRGLSRQQSERLIVFGFLSPVLAQIPVEALRAEVTALVERKMMA